VWEENRVGERKPPHKTVKDLVVHGAERDLRNL